MRASAWGRNIVEAALLYPALTFMTDDECTLLGLHGFVVAYIYQRFYNPVEGVYIIVPYNEVVRFFNQYGRFFPFLRFPLNAGNIISFTAHMAKIRKKAIRN